MSPLFVRQTHWNIPCTQATLAAGIQTLEKALNAPGRGTPTAAGSSFFANDWQEFKIGTYAGRQVLMLMEVCLGQAAFSPITSLALKNLLLRQREHRFQADYGKKKYTYLLFGYTPFRSQAYTSYQQARSLADKNALLQSHLLFHLSELADRMNWPAREPLTLDQLRVGKEKKSRLGGIFQASFDLQFRTNLFIPEFLGLGRGAQLGLGVVRPLRGVRQK
ncbi:CRISPR-associated endonuclease Cas6 [Lewinella sp. LCG006]|uniref:CRISPR-associated endonuclease Cas6 n=1 Tax=Lewinella sp. LCG006 TaxID=3231911 RepID=UPI003460AA13